MRGKRAGIQGIRQGSLGCLPSSGLIVFRAVRVLRAARPCIVFDYYFLRNGVEYVIMLKTALFTEKRLTVPDLTCYHMLKIQVDRRKEM